jgi:Tfp pilus assembly protein FimV
MFDSALDTEHVFGHSRSMRNARVRRGRAAVLTIGLSLILAAPAAARAMTGDREASPATPYVVQAGDTLWSIALRHAPGRDPRIVADAIARTNDLDPGSLVPGQELRLPDKT